MLSALDVFVANQVEAAAVLGLDLVHPLAAARRLREIGPSAAVVDGGSGGCRILLCSAVESGVVSTPVVVDASGAVDAFLAAFAIALSRQMSLRQAVDAGVRAWG